MNKGTSSLKSLLEQYYEKLTEEERHYSGDAYCFLLKTMYVLTNGDKSEKTEVAKNVSAAEIADKFTHLMLAEFGPAAQYLVKNWGISSYGDIGRMVYALIRVNVLSKCEGESMADFEKIKGFDKRFQANYREEGPYPDMPDALKTEMI